MSSAAVADARSRILAEATRLFGHRGFGATSVREVVDAAGVTKPTLYYWFDNKDALFLECVQAKVDELRDVVLGSLSGPGTLTERLERYVDRYVGQALADEDGVRLMMTVQHPVDEGQPEVDLFSVQTENVVAIQELLEAARIAGDVRADIDTGLVALSLVGTANMHVLASLHGMPLPEDLAVRIVQHFLHGVAP